MRYIWVENSSKKITINNATRLAFTIKFSLTGADTFSSRSNPFLHQASARQCEQEIPLFQPQCSDAQIVRSPINQLLTDAWTLCNVALGLACSPGVFWVGERLFMFVLLLPPSLILWQRKIGESRNSNQALSRAKTFTRPKKTPALQATLGQGWKPFSDLTGVECDVLGQQVPRQTFEDHSTVISFLEQLLRGSRVFCDSGFRHSQPNLLRETQVMRLGAQQVNNGQWIHPPRVEKITC